MWFLTVLAWIAAIYCACGVLTALAVALIVRKQSSSEAKKKPGYRRDYAWLMLKMFAVWPVVVAWMAIFAIITIVQKHRTRP